MPLPLQVKLLRVLQEKRFEPLGDVAPVDADVRVIAATNADLEERVAAGTFRRDLFYRLNVVALKLPSLTERLEDLPLLCEHIIRRLNLEKGKQIEGLSEDAMGALLRHDFPGNVRELENILEYAFILCPDGFIQLEHLPEQLARQGDTARRGPLSMEEIKCRAVKDALERNEGRKMQTCRELGISKDTLRRMLARCGEDGPPSRT
jgi:transcriptional regulator with PAS, ATPase and Fis domain